MSNVLALIALCAKDAYAGVMDIAKKQEFFSKAVLLAQIELKGKNNLYTSHNGHMFSFVGKDGVVGVRLGSDRRAEFLAGEGANQPMQYDTIMKEYVEIDDSLITDTAAVAELLQEGLAYVSTLKKK